MMTTVFVPESSKIKSNAIKYGIAGGILETLTRDYIPGQIEALEILGAKGERFYEPNTPWGERVDLEVAVAIATGLLTGYETETSELMEFRDLLMSAPDNAFKEECLIVIDQILG